MNPRTSGFVTGASSVILQSQTVQAILHLSETFARRSSIALGITALLFVVDAYRSNDLNYITDMCSRNSFTLTKIVTEYKTDENQYGEWKEMISGSINYYVITIEGESFLLNEKEYTMLLDGSDGNQYEVVNE